MPMHVFEKKPPQFSGAKSVNEVHISGLHIFFKLLFPTILFLCVNNTELTPNPLFTPSPPGSSRPSPNLGINLGFINDRSHEFVDLAKSMKGWEKIGRARCPENPQACTNAPIDNNGDPVGDAQTVFLDVRPWGAWYGDDETRCPNCQDGHETADVSGVYKLSFQGKAVISPADGSFEVVNQLYDSESNTTTADLVLTAEEQLLYVAFTKTRRRGNELHGASDNTGITNIHLIRPGYPADTTQTFTNDFLNALIPFTTIRTMTWTGAPYDIPLHTDADNSIDWNERNLPEWRQPQRDGVAWEYIIELANVTGKDIWINIPVHASNDYIAGLAQLLKKTLNPAINIYVEYSNELWNPHFDQYQYNVIAALADSLTGNSVLAEDGEKNLEILGMRRAIQRGVQTSGIFADIFTPQAINQQVRVVHSWFISRPGQVKTQLDWVADTYGNPAGYFYAIAGGSYFFDDNMPLDIPVAEVFPRLLKASDASVGNRIALQRLADQFGLHSLIYEGGPDTARQLQWDRSTQLLETLIQAHKMPQMSQVLLYDLWNNWFNHPEMDGDLFMFYDLAHVYSRFGMFGLTDDISRQHTPKFDAVYAITGQKIIKPPPPAHVKITPSNTEITLSWSPVFGADRYLLLRQTGNSHNPELIAEVTETTFVDRDVVADEDYIYTVAGKNNVGTSYAKPLTVNASPPPLDQFVHIVHTDVPPILDGIPDDLWQLAPATPVTNLLTGSISNEADLSGNFATLYDADNLYILYRINDDTFRPKRGKDPWNGDAVELFLDGGNEKLVYDSNDEQYIFTPGKSSPWSRNGQVAGVIVAHTETPEGYIMEIAIPWRNIQVTPTPGLLIGFEAEVDDSDDYDNKRDGKLGWWAEVDKAWTTPALFGTAVLMYD